MIWKHAGPSPPSLPVSDTTRIVISLRIRAASDAAASDDARVSAVRQLVAGGGGEGREQRGAADCDGPEKAERAQHGGSPFGKHDASTGLEKIVLARG